MGVGVFEQLVPCVEHVHQVLVDLLVVADLVVDNTGIPNQPVIIESHGFNAQMLGISLQIVEFVNI